MFGGPGRTSLKCYTRIFLYPLSSLKFKSNGYSSICAKNVPELNLSGLDVDSSLLSSGSGVVCTSSPAFLLGCPLDHLCCVFVIVCVGIPWSQQARSRKISIFCFFVLFLIVACTLPAGKLQNARKHAQNARKYAQN